MFNFEELFKTFFNINAQFDDIIEEPIDNSTTRHLEPPNRTYEIGQKLAEKDDKFSTKAMLSYAQMLFREVHKCVALRDLEPIRKLVSGRLYKVLEELISDEKVDAIEEYSFDSQIEKNYITSYKVDDKYVYEYLTVCIIMNMPSNDIKYIYRLTFRREVNKSARAGVPVTHAISCPNCGAALESVVATKCSYCKSLIEPAKYEWELLKFEIVKR